MFKLLITIGQTPYDYTDFLDVSSIQISEVLNTPSVMQFSLTIWGGQFDVPPQNAYVQFVSTRINALSRRDVFSPITQSLFTGYISAPPTISYRGISPYALSRTGGQMFTYSFQAASDEVLINMKTVPFIPAFVNRTQGQILIDLAEILTPGMFDTQNVMDGDIIPYFEYSSQQNWSQIAKQFADSIRFRYKVRDHIIWFRPYGDDYFGIDYDETKRKSQFKADSLITKPLVVPMVNDVTIIGDAEAGNIRRDYFLGDGFTGNFPLRHKVFLGTATLLLQETWQQGEVNTQQWFLSDPGTNFDFTAGALNIITNPNNAFSDFGESYLALNNGIELAGGINLQHGEFVFNDASLGIVGGIFEDSNFDAATWLCGFYVSSPLGATVTASGAVGVIIQPMFHHVPIGSSLTTQANHTYVLQTVVTAPAYTRYTRTYRSQDGNEYGGVSNDISGNVTLIIQDYNVAAATGFYYSPNITQVSVGPIQLPAFATYCLADNVSLNVTVSNTTIALMPLGSLEGELGTLGLATPSGVVLPAINRSHAEYIGPVLPWAGAGSGAIFPAPVFVNPGAAQLVLGNGFQLQAAQISQGNEADTLSFYSQTLPTAGTPLTLRSWETRAAVSRVQDYLSIQEQQFITGDDGIRAAIVTDLNPLPRTSEDCDNAALAYLADRTRPLYNGTYTCESILFEGITRESQYWPTVGRYFRVNAPQRGIDKLPYLVTNLQFTVLSLDDEILSIQFSFGADLYLEKVLKNFVDVRPPNVLAKKDSANPPNARFTQSSGTTFLGDLPDLRIDQLRIVSDQVTVIMDAPYNRNIEVRLQDNNWGRGKTFDLVGVFTGPEFVLPRYQYDQTWYCREVGIVGTVLTSRRSTVLRCVYPQRPAAPNVISADSHYIQLDFSGDHRNIYVVELRDEFNRPLVQKPVNSYQDLHIDLTMTSNTAALLPPGVRPIRIFFAFFANLQWEYSPSAAYQWEGKSSVPAIVVPDFPQPTLTLGSRIGTALTVYATISPDRNDVRQEEWRIYTASDLNPGSLVVSVNNAGQTGTLVTTVPATGTLYVTCARNDFLGPGPASVPLVIP